MGIPEEDEEGIADRQGNEPECLAHMASFYEKPVTSELDCRSVYQFDLDKKRLRVFDEDFLFLSKDKTLAPDSYHIKKIGRKDNVVAQLWMLPERKKQSLKTGGVLLDDPSVSYLDYDSETGWIKLHVKMPWHISYDRPVAITVRHDTYYTSSTSKLLYGGSVQPADFIKVCECMITSARKTVEIEAFSQHYLDGMIFNGSSPMEAFPNLLISKREAEAKFWLRAKLDLKLDLKERRAHYFAFVALPRDEKLLISTECMVGFANPIILNAQQYDLSMASNTNKT